MLTRLIKIVLGFFLFFLPLGFNVVSQSSDESFDVAQKAFFDGFYSASITLFEKFIRDFPKDKRVNLARLYIAESLYFQKKYSESLNILKGLESLQEPSERLDEVYYWLAKIYLQGKNYHSASSYVKKLIENFPESLYYWRAYYLLSKIYTEKRDYDKAKNILFKIEKEAKSSDIVKDAILGLLRIYYLLGEREEIINTVSKYESLFDKNKDKAFILFYKGEALYTGDKVEEALSVFQHALELTEDTHLKSILYKRIGDCWLKKEDADKAKAKFEEIKDPEIKLFSYIGYYFHFKERNKCLSLIEEFIKKFPESEYIYYVLLNKADILYDMGRIKDALYIYEQVKDKVTPKYSKDLFNKAQYGVAWCYLKLGEFRKSIDEFKKMIEASDDPIIRISAQIQLADVYQERGDFELALETYNRILKEYPDNVYTDYIQFQIGLLFLKNDRLEEAKLSFKNLEKNFPSSKLIPQARYYLAATYFSEGNYEEAQRILEENMDRFSETYLRDKAYYLYGKCLFNEGNYTKAIQVFEEIEKNSQDVKIKQSALIDKGYAYLNLSKWDEAEKIFKKFLSQFHHSEYFASVMLNLANIYFIKDNLKEAERFYQRILDLPLDTDIKFEAKMGIASIREEQKKIDEAKSILREVIKKAPLVISCKAKVYLAHLLQREGDIKSALSLYDEVIKEKIPISKVALVEKAYLLKEQSEYEEAVSLFRKAIEDGIKEPDIYFSLGYCLEKLGKDRDALESYFKVIYLFDNVKYKIKSYFRIAKIYEDNGQIEEASQIYNKIISFNVPESLVAKERLKRIESRAP